MSRPTALGFSLRRSGQGLGENFVCEGPLADGKNVFFRHPHHGDAGIVDGGTGLHAHKPVVSRQLQEFEIAVAPHAHDGEKDEEAAECSSEDRIPNHLGTRRSFPDLPHSQLLMRRKGAQ